MTPKSHKRETCEGCLYYHDEVAWCNPVIARHRLRTDIPLCDVGDYPPDSEIKNRYSPACVDFAPTLQCRQVMALESIVYKLRLAGIEVDE